MNALVTGGLGFIGSHVVDLLIEKGLDVTVIDNLSTGDKRNSNRNAKYLYTDLLDVEEHKLQDFEYIFHLAALPRIQPSFTEPIPHENANVIATVRLLEALKTSKRLQKLVYSASSACYGTPLETPTSENERIKPLSPYALQKYAAEQYCLILGERFDIPVVSLRYFNAYGPRSFNADNKYNAYTSVIGIFHHQRLNNQPLTITGDGLQKRDFIHVRDIARANYHAATLPATGEFFNVGFGKCYSILEIAQMFDCPYTFIPERAGEALITLANIEKIRSQLAWQPEIDLSTGIKTYL